MKLLSARTIVEPPINKTRSRRQISVQLSLHSASDSILNEIGGLFAEVAMTVFYQNDPVSQFQCTNTSSPNTTMRDEARDYQLLTFLDCKTSSRLVPSKAFHVACEWYNLCSWAAADHAIASPVTLSLTNADPNAEYTIRAHHNDEPGQRERWCSGEAPRLY